jgi:large subunit ribosomal protein L10
MAITRKQKEAILAELIDSFSASRNVVFAKNLGLSVGQITNFRTKLREKGAKYKIAKKTLIKLAASKANFPELQDDALEGPVGVIFSPEDELLPAQAANEFAKDNDKFEIAGGVFFDAVISAEEVVTYASIPPREELLAKLLGSMKSPFSGFVSVAGGTISGFVRVCSEIAKQKEATA